MMTDMPMPAQRSMPSFSLCECDLPSLKSMDVGSKKYLVIQVEMTGKRKMDKYELPEGAEDMQSGEFKMKKIMVLGDKPVDAKSLDKKDWNDRMAKALTRK